MQRLPISVFLILLSFTTITAQNTWRDKLAPEVRNGIDRQETPDVLVVFREQADVRDARFLKGKTVKAQFVLDRLLETASRTQARALQFLKEQDAFVNSFYLVNAIAVRQASPEVLRQLAQFPEIAYIAADPDVPMPEPVVQSEPVTDRGIIEWGVNKINAPAVWAMGYTGQGITVAGADTGYDWQHPALKAHYRGWNAQNGTADHNYNWHDAIHEIDPMNGDSTSDPSNNPCGVNSLVPCDDHNHGTHTMGTMVGDDGGDNQIGVAPGAKWIACRNMERGSGRPSTYIECFQWFLAPTDLDNQHPDVSKAPHVINNSWYCSVGEGCTDLAINEVMRQVVINLRASGVVVVVSNGNFGSSGCNTTYGPPAYFDESFSVGATAENDTITNFSSRGPVTIDFSNRLKPNVVAPGAAVRSSIRNGGYAHFWGTSMAGPHVVGLVALILSARPDLAGEVDLIEDLIEETAVPGFDTTDCGDVSGLAHPNNTYGYGRVDALGAVLKAFTLSEQEPGVSLQPQIGVSPNPVSDQTIFSFEHLDGNNRLELFDVEGRRVFTHDWVSYGQFALPVSLANQPTGIYVWRLKSGDHNAAGKLIRQ